jgi:hypothetical protein
MMFAEPLIWAAIGFAAMASPPILGRSDESVHVQAATLQALRPVIAAYLAAGRTGFVNATFRAPPISALTLHAPGAPLGLKPPPLPPPNPRAKPLAETVKLQRQYRRLMELGFFAEAEEVAARFAGERIALTGLFGAEMHTPERHRVGYRGAGRDLIAKRPTPFDAAGQTRFDEDFQGVALDVALRRLHSATNVTIRVALADDDRPKVFAGGAGLSLTRCLDLICASCGCTWTVRQGEVLVERPTVTVLRDAGLPTRR